MLANMPTFSIGNFFARSENLAIYFTFRNLFLFLNRDELSEDLTGQFWQSFHRMKAFLVKLTDLNLFFQFLKGRCHGNQFWAK